MSSTDPRRGDAFVAMGLAFLMLVGVLARAGCAAQGAEPARAPRAAATPFSPLLFGPGLDPTRATAEVWQALPGIGPSRAHAIVEARRLAPFCSVQDLLRVPGLGPKTLARVRPWIAPRPWARECAPRHGTTLP